MYNLKIDQTLDLSLNCPTLWRNYKGMYIYNFIATIVSRGTEDEGIAYCSDLSSDLIYFSRYVIIYKINLSQ